MSPMTLGREGLAKRHEVCFDWKLWDDMSGAAKRIGVCARAQRVTSKRRMERNKNRRLWVTVTRWEALLSHSSAVNKGFSVTCQKGAVFPERAASLPRNG